MPRLKPFHLNGLTRKEQVVIHRIRIGHTRITHKYLMEDPLKRQPPCNFCYLEQLSVSHLLIDCLHFQNIRRVFFTVTSMKDLFDKIHLRCIINFLKAANLYEQI